MSRPKWSVDDPLAMHAYACFEQHCIEQFHSLGTECILACKSALHYAVGLTLSYAFEDQSALVSYSPKHQEMNQVQARHLTQQFLQVNDFSAVEWMLRVMQDNR